MVQPERGISIAEGVKAFGSVHEVKTTAEYLRLVIDLQVRKDPVTRGGSNTTNAIHRVLRSGYRSCQHGA